MTNQNYEDYKNEIQEQSIKASMGLVWLVISISFFIYRFTPREPTHNIYYNHQKAADTPNDLLVLVLVIVSVIALFSITYFTSMYLLYKKPYKKYMMMKNMFKQITIEKEIEVDLFNHYTFIWEKFITQFSYVKEKNKGMYYLTFLHKTEEIDLLVMQLNDYLLNKELAFYFYLSDSTVLLKIPKSKLNEQHILNLLQDYLYLANRFKIEPLTETEYLQIEKQDE